MTEQVSLVEYPCDFLIKVFGSAIPEFELAVISIIKKHKPDFNPDELTFRLSKGKQRYRSLSIRVFVENKEELDTIYKDLTSHELVIMAL
ncbi:MAG: hypothetical protein LEGION0398_MBIBDBAK_01128 [Legionellaceae bacterium]